MLDQVAQVAQVVGQVAQVAQVVGQAVAVILAVATRVMEALHDLNANQGHQAIQTLSDQEQLPHLLSTVVEPHKANYHKHHCLHDQPEQVQQTQWRATHLNHQFVLFVTQPLDHQYQQQ